MSNSKPFTFETEAAHNNLHLALADLPVDFFDLAKHNMERDKETITCLRSVLIKPEHFDWFDKIWEILDRSARIVLDKRPI